MQPDRGREENRERPLGVLAIRINPGVLGSRVPSSSDAGSCCICRRLSLGSNGCHATNILLALLLMRVVLAKNQVLAPGRWLLAKTGSM